MILRYGQDGYEFVSLDEETSVVISQKWSGDD